MTNQCYTCEKRLPDEPHYYLTIFKCKECFTTETKCGMCDDVIKGILHDGYGRFYGQHCKTDKHTIICSSSMCGLYGECIKCIAAKDMEKFRRIADKVLSGSTVKNATKK